MRSPGGDYAPGPYPHGGRAGGCDDRPFAGFRAAGEAALALQGETAMRMKRGGLLVVMSVAALLGAGCLDEIVPLHQNGVNSPDGSATMNPNPTDDLGSLPPADGDGGAPPAVVDMGAPLDMTDCIPKSAVAVDGHHNNGLDCLTCHSGQAAGAPIFLVAGTLYNAAGTTPVPQATIRITDGAGHHADLVTSSQTVNGNFFLEKANANGLTPPFQVEASSCPNTQRMPNPVTAANLSCNNCHNGTANPRIHLP